MSFYKHRNKRIVPRAADGRFEKSTLANTFGLGAPVCQKCNSFNPYKLFVDDANAHG